MSSTTKPSTKEPHIDFDTLSLNGSHYYVKRRSIVEKITFEHRTFYVKFERIDETLTETVVSQHLNRQYTIAVALLDHGRINNLVLEYRGGKPARFYHTSKHLLHTLQIEDYQYYKGKKSNYLQLFIPVDALSLTEADDMIQKISDELQMRLTKEWKCFPDKSLPECYNIITLPYQKYKP